MATEPVVHQLVAVDSKLRTAKCGAQVPARDTTTMSGWSQDTTCERCLEAP